MLFAQKMNPCVIPNSLEDLGRFLYRNPPELCLLCVPEPSRTSSAITGTLPAICAAALRNLIGHLHQNPPEPHQPSAPEPAGTLFAMCTGILRNLVCYLHRNLLEPRQPSAPEPAGTSSAICAGTICTGTRRNFVCYVYRNTPEPHQPSPEPYPEPHQPSAPERAGTLFAICTGTIRNHPDPHQPSAPEPSGTSSAFCTGTLWNLISFLHRNALELSGTLRNLLRNLGLQLHRIAPELFWAKDPIASFAVGEKDGFSIDLTSFGPPAMLDLLATSGGAELRLPEPPRDRRAGLEPGWVVAGGPGRFFWPKIPENDDNVDGSSSFLTENDTFKAIGWTIQKPILMFCNWSKNLASRPSPKPHKGRSLDVGLWRRVESSDLQPLKSVSQDKSC